MNRLVDRFGRTGFALLASLMWAVPMAAWAGSADLSPIDQTAYPRVALAIGLVMLVVWLVLVSRLRHAPVSSVRKHRFDIGQMTKSEKRWTLATAAFGIGLVAWLNGAATVDWAPLADAIKAGKAGPAILAVALGLFLVAMVAGIGFSWRRATAAYRSRPATDSSLYM
jgi:hypothetical protein